MRVTQWRVVAWATLVFGLVASSVAWADGKKGGSSPPAPKTGGALPKVNTPPRAPANPPAHPTGNPTAKAASPATHPPVVGGLKNVPGGSVTNIGNNVTQATPLDMLQHAQRLVSGAEYGYEGHRLKAAREIEEAIRKLTPPKPVSIPSAFSGHSTAGGGHSGGKPTPPVTPQALKEADADLRQALKLLKDVYGLVQEVNADAAKNVEGAIKELKAALKID